MSDVWAPEGHAGRRVPRAWVALLGVHGTVTREMDAHLRAAHGLTLRDYEVLLFLSWSPEQRLRPVDLADCVLLTQGGVTRLLAGLESAGLVERVRSRTDRRVVYARLTAEGSSLLEAAAETHVDDIRSLFTNHFSERELASLGALLGRPPGGEPNSRKA